MITLSESCVLVRPVRPGVTVESRTLVAEEPAESAVSVAIDGK
jgi:hypothetical protein